MRFLQKGGVAAPPSVKTITIPPPRSQFNREAIATELKLHGISYVFLGKELGARTDDPTCYVDGQARYELIANTKPYKEALQRVVKGAEEYRVALMCAEADPLTCHRTVLICRSLEKKNLDITHIHGDGRLESQEELTQRLIRATGLAQGDFFVSGDVLERAYEKQGRKIAYRRPPSTPTPVSPESSRT